VGRLNLDDAGLRCNVRDVVSAAARNEAILGGAQIEHRHMDVCQRGPHVGARDGGKAGRRHLR
jgi:hypothetical protein